MWDLSDTLGTIAALLAAVLLGMVIMLVLMTQFPNETREVINMVFG